MAVVVEEAVVDVVALKGIPSTLAPICLSATMGRAIRFAIRKLASSHAKILMVATFGFLPPDQNPIEDFVELVI